MYIVTYEEYSIVRESYESKFRMCDTVENGLDFMKILYETGYCKDIDIWDAELMPHRCSITANVKLTDILK